MISASRPQLKIYLGGDISDSPPVRFAMRTDIDEPGAVAELEFPNPAPAVSPGETVAVDLVHDDSDIRVFTGELVKNVPHHHRRLFVLADDIWKLRRARFQASYRNEQDERIIRDILDAAGIDGGTIAAPGIQFPRFSTPQVPGDRALAMIVESFPGHGVTQEYRWFFNSANVFRLGTSGDAHNGGETIGLSSRADIVGQRGDTITILPRPIRHSMRVAVDGVGRWVTRSDLTISPKRSRLVLTLGALP